MIGYKEMFDLEMTGYSSEESYYNELSYRILQEERLDKVIEQIINSKEPQNLDVVELAKSI